MELILYPYIQKNNKIINNLIELLKYIKNSYEKIN